MLQICEISTYVYNHRQVQILYSLRWSSMKYLVQALDDPAHD